jgi:hypothetical protein
MIVRDPARVLRECALYRRWVLALHSGDADSEIVREVLLEMLADMMVQATLRE